MSNVIGSRGDAASPVWIRALGGLLIALLGGAFAFALWIVLVNFSRIGV